MPDIGYAASQLRAAVQLLAATTEPLEVRLQNAWSEHVQTLWEDRYLPDGLNERFQILWDRYGERSDDRRNTALRKMNERELTEAASELVALAFDTAKAASV